MVFLLEVAVGDREISSVEVWAIGGCGDGIGPFHEVCSSCENNATEDVSSAAGGPEFGN